MENNDWDEYDRLYEESENKFHLIIKEIKETEANTKKQIHEYNMIKEKERKINFNQYDSIQMLDYKRKRPDVALFKQIDQKFII